jgi:hypothetical protein
MITNKKPAPGWHREAGLSDAFDSRNFKLIPARLKALLLSLTLYGAEIIGMLAMILWGVLA